MSSRRGWRLGAVSYFNARPLIEGLEDDPQIESLSLAEPSVLAAALQAGELDAALASSILLVDHPELQMLPDPVIGSEGRVASVRLRSRVPMASIDRIHGDPASRTSNVLAALLAGPLAQPRRAAVPIVDDPQAPAWVVIGDRALVEGEPVPYDYDLGDEWQARTGLGFIYAGWILAPQTPAAAFGECAARAAERGLARRDVFAVELAAACRLAPERARDYFMTSIRYRTTPRMRAGLEHFLALARTLAAPARTPQ